MQNINQIDAQQVLTQYSSDRLQKKEEAEKDDKNQFLELMIAQLENQNPLDPKDGTEFLSQLAQFSTVDGIERLNANMSGMTDSFRSSQALQATALVGREVSVPGNRGLLVDGEAMKGTIELPGSRSEVQLDVYSMTGELIRTVPMGTHPSGDLPFSWDGLDSGGIRVPAGEYMVVATAQGGEAEERLETKMRANVDSVTLDSVGGVTLNLRGMGNVPLSDIKEIN